MKNLNNIQKATLKAIFLLIVLFIFASTTGAQAQTTTGSGAPATTEAKADYKIVGNEIVSTKTATTKKAPVKTKYTHTIKEVIYPVYKSSRGSYFIIRISKKSGKEYKQYLKVE